MKCLMYKNTILGKNHKITVIRIAIHWILFFPKTQENQYIIHHKKKLNRYTMNF